MRRSELARAGSGFAHRSNELPGERRPRKPLVTRNADHDIHPFGTHLELAAVQFEERQRGHKRRALVPVNEGMVSRDAPGIRGGHLRQ